MEGVFSLTSYFTGQDSEPHSEQEVNKILYLPVHATKCKVQIGCFSSILTDRSESQGAPSSRCLCESELYQWAHVCIYSA